VCGYEKLPLQQYVTLGSGIPVRFTRPPIFGRASYFDDAFGKPAYKVHDNTFLYIEGNAPDEAVTIAVSATERKIAVTAIADGDWSVNYVREFFEAPFFLCSESEQLYAVLDADSSAGAATLDRFDVKINVFKTLESIVIATEFEPPSAY
jgi:hypothetical protein